MSVRKLGTLGVVGTLAAGVAWAAAPQPVSGPERMPPVPAASFDAAQRKAAEDFVVARKAPLFGPFTRLIRSPDVMTSARSMGDYLRYGSAIGTTLSEFVILFTAGEWAQSYEWSVHAPIALRQGIRPEVVQALAERRRPAAMSEDEAICYDFSLELQHEKRVSDATYARALKRFGEKGVVDLTAINGYYTFLAMQLNMMRTPPDPAGPALARAPR